jgi:hypothetical protein
MRFFVTFFSSNSFSVSNGNAIERLLNIFEEAFIFVTTTQCIHHQGIGQYSLGW